MADTTQPQVGNGRFGDIPLPGTYPMLTVQVNATIHQASQLCKWVSIIREPLTQVELMREHCSLSSYGRSLHELSLHVVSFETVLPYLLGFAPVPLEGPLRG